MYCVEAGVNKNVNIVNFGTGGLCSQNGTCSCNCILLEREGGGGCPTILGESVVSEKIK